MNDINKLREILRTSQEKVGYFFNKNNEQVLSLLQGLTTNRDRYGYMSCPCRLASCDREKDERYYLSLVLIVRKMWPNMDPATVGSM